MVLNEEVTTKVKEVFKAMYEANENAKAYNESAREMKSELAKDLQVKTEVISNVYSTWVKMKEKPEIMSSVDQIIESIL